MPLVDCTVLLLQEIYKLHVYIQSDRKALLKVIADENDHSMKSNREIGAIGAAL